MQTAQRLIEEANRYLETARISSVALNVPIGDLIALIGFAQLGLRHPSAAVTPSATLVRELIEELITGLDPDGGPLFDLLTKGFDPNFDVMRPPPGHCGKCGALLRGPRGYGCEICGARD